jgi:hypothetical protein
VHRNLDISFLYFVRCLLCRKVFHIEAVDSTINRNGVKVSVKLSVCLLKHNAVKAYMEVKVQLHQLCVRH